MTSRQIGCIIQKLTLLKELKMKTFVAFLLGMFVATVGISGVASAVDKMVGKTQTIMKETVK